MRCAQMRNAVSDMRRYAARGAALLRLLYRYLDIEIRY